MSAQPKPPTWEHQDSDPKAALALAFGAQSYGARPDGSAMTTADRVRLVRTLAIATEYAVENARVVGVPPSEKDGTTTLGAETRGDLFATRAHCYAASTIARTWQLFADPGRHVVHAAVTRDGEPARLASALDPMRRGEAGLPPLLLAAVVVVAVAAYTAAICYVGQAAAEVVDRKLTQDALTARMVATQARAVALVDNHSERERVAGHAIPWSPQEMQVLDALLGTQRDVAARTHSPLPNPFVGAVEKAGDVAGDVGKKAATAAVGLGVIAAVVGGAYLLTR
jgi:hypothetical protein